MTKTCRVDIFIIKKIKLLFLGVISVKPRFGKLK